MTDQKDKPVLDQDNFGKLLEAAHVLQEHNRKMRELEERVEAHSQRLREQEAAEQAPLQKVPAEEKSRPSDYTLTLAEIVEAQRQIQARHLPLDQAIAVVAEKVAHITGANGAAIGILDGKVVRYRAGAGNPALPAGSEVSLTKAICCASIRTGQVIRSEDVNTEVLFDPEPCRQRGILSLVAVPVYHDGDIVGALELYFDKIHGFAEQDIHTCQLLAGLVTEAIGRNSESTLKQSMAAERSTMLAAIERLQPNLQALAADHSTPAPATDAAAHAVTAVEYTCWQCAEKLLAEEQFCGNCGAPRASDSEPSSLQSKVASAWHKQQASQQNLATAPSNGAGGGHGPALKLPPSREPNAEAGAENAAESFPSPESAEQAHDAASASTQSASQLDREIEQPEDEGNVENAAAAIAATQAPANHDLVWTSAARTRDFLESLSRSRAPGAFGRFWTSRRGDVYLAIALVLVVAVIRWGIWSNHSVGAVNRGPQISTSASRRPQPAPEPELSFFDKVLINLGLADAPEPAEYKGNPNTPVWVDLHTALYYCPGSDLYSKTPKGKLASQRDAQLDHFEPANRKPCD